MENIFLLIFLLSPILLLVGLIKPSLFSNILKRDVGRKKISLFTIGLAIISFVLFGVTSKPVIDSFKISETPTPQEQVNNEALDTSNITEEIIELTSTPKPSNREKATVVKVVDGDTMDFSINGKTERIRIIGINTPETVDPRKSVECFGIEASNKAKELLKIGSIVELETDTSQDNRDKYSRLLRYVWINENTDFGFTMIKEGYAYEYTYDIPYKYRSSYKQAQKEAEEWRKGLWADNACIITPKPTVRPTTVPVIYIAPTSPPTYNTGESWVCDCSKVCDEMFSCNEAYFQLNNCGCSKRDGDKDGVPCEIICSGG